MKRKNLKKLGGYLIFCAIYGALWILSARYGLPGWGMALIIIAFVITLFVYSVYSMKKSFKKD